MKNFAALSLATTLMVACSAPASAESVFDGTYLGGFGGYGFSHLESKGYDDTIEATGHGLVGGAFLGWGQTIESFYFGIENAVDFSEIDTDAVYENRTMDLQRKAAIATSVRVGFLPSEDVLVFGTVGISNAYYEGEVTGSSINFAAEGWQRSYRLGLGVDNSFSDDLFTRVSLDADIVNESNVMATTAVAKVGFGLRF